jgi:DHA2 family multidrug resistance protein
MEDRASSVNPWLVTLAVLLPTVMEVLDTSIVNVALPHMAGSLGADTSESTWVLTSYLVSNAIVLPMTYWLSRLFGRRAYLLGCVALFTGASVLCATAESLALLIVYRVIQGAAGGALQPLSQAILLESFPERERGPAMAVWGMGIVVAPVVAPLLGGYLTERWSWHWIFLINAPIGVLAFVFISAFVWDPPHARRAPVSLDALGIALLVVGMGSLQILLDKGQEWGWWGSHQVRVLAVLSSASLVALVIQQLRRRDGLIDLSVFRDRTFSLGTALIFAFGFVLYSSLTLIPIFVQTLLNYSAFESGVVISPRGLGVMATMTLAGMLLRRTDPRWVMLCGFPFLVSSGVLMAGFNLDTGPRSFVATMVIQGLGLGFLFVPLTTATVSDIPAERMSAATGLFNLMRNVGGGVGVSLTQTLLSQAQQLHHLELGRFVNPYNPAYTALRDQLVGRFLGEGAGPALAREKALSAIARMVERQAAVLSYDDVFWMIAAAFLVMIPAVLAMRPRRGESQDRVPALEAGGLEGS